MIDESTTKPSTIGSSDANRATDETLGILQRSIERLDRKPTSLEEPTMKASTHDSLDTNMATTEISGTKATIAEVVDSRPITIGILSLSGTTTDTSGSDFATNEDPAIEIIFKFEEDLLADGKAKKTIVSYVGAVKLCLFW